MRSPPCTPAGRGCRTDGGKEQEVAEGSGPFVIVVASEKGGVGKTTLATNLAVYLKALREELPVTIASFDNHFSVDNMFAIGGHRGGSVAGLFAGAEPETLAALGEYGVQFLTSERTLQPPDDDVGRLRRLLAETTLSGLFILDTRPILDYFTLSALHAADLILVPVKDRPSLVNAAALHQALCQDGGDPARIWLVPSLVDLRLRLKGTVGMRDYLVYAARERGYQVVETFLAKSPKVEALASGFSSRIHPVLTHARGTLVHRQFRELADFVLERFAAGPPPRPSTSAAEGGRPFAECPVCLAAAGADGHFFMDPRSRRRGFVHAACLERLLPGSEFAVRAAAEGGLAIAPAAEDGVALFLFDAAGDLMATEHIEEGADGPLGRSWRQATGRPADTFYRDLLLVSLDAGGHAAFDSAVFARWRRRVLRELRALL